jgi:hypothetical protein
MQINRIHLGELKSLSAHHPAERWLQRMAMAGLVFDTADPDAIAVETRRMFSLAWSLADVEALLERRRFSATRVFLAPKGSLLGLLLCYMTTYHFATKQDDFGDALWMLGTPWMVAGSIAALGTGVVFLINHRLRRTQRAEFSMATTSRAHTVTELVAARDAVLRLASP